VKVPTRDNAIVNRLNKTKVEREVDHEAERQERLRAEGRKKKSAAIDTVSFKEVFLFYSSSLFLFVDVVVLWIVSPVACCDGLRVRGCLFQNVGQRRRHTKNGSANSRLFPSPGRICDFGFS